MAQNLHTFPEDGSPQEGQGESGAEPFSNPPDFRMIFSVSRKLRISLNLVPGYLSSVSFTILRTWLRNAVWA